MKRKKQTPTPPTVDPFSRWEQFDAKKRAEREEKDRQARAELDRHLLFSARLNEDGTFADPQEAEVMRRVFSAPALQEAFNGLSSADEARAAVGEMAFDLARQMSGRSEDDLAEHLRRVVWGQRGVKAVRANLEAVKAEVFSGEDEATS